MQHKDYGKIFPDPAQLLRDPHKTRLWISDSPPQVSAAVSGTTGVSTQPMTPLTSTETLQQILRKLVCKRMLQDPPPSDVLLMRFPVGLFFARDREANGIRDEIASSFDYWNKDSGEYFDMFFPGWYFLDRKLQFNQDRFQEHRSEIEGLSKWRYSGETDILIVNFDYDIETHQAHFDFTEGIVLLVEEMIRKQQTGSLATLLALINNQAHKHSDRDGDNAVWKISDSMGLLRGRQSFWDALKKFVLRDFSQVYDNVRPFGVCDLRP